MPEYSINNHWMNILRINKKLYGSTREDVRTLMEKHSIQTQPIWFLNHKQKPYKNAFAYNNIDKATKLHNNSLCIPSGGPNKDLIFQRF